MASKKSEAILILPNIRSTYNVGAIFRTADAAGVSKIYLVGITPTPVDKFGRVRADVAKSALGAEQTVSWESVKTLAPLVRRLKKEGFTVVAVEQDARAVHYTKVHRTEKMAFMLGPEVTGLSKKEIALADSVAELPMRGSKESLNVSVAAGIALYGILKL